MTNAKYFKGQTVTGKVEAASEQTFREVVDCFRLPPMLDMERAAFMALPKVKRNELKQVPFFVPAVFRTSPSDRRTAHALHCNLLFVDIDEMADGRCPAAPFVSNPENLHTALNGFNFAAHTTASSTPEKPRMRVVIDAKAISPEDYPLAIRTVSNLLGLPEITPESKKPQQPMFLPVIFQDTREGEYPLITHFLNGRAFTTTDIASELPDEPRTPRKGKSDDSLDYLRAPVPEVTLALAKEALACIDPDCPYFEWLQVAAALRHQFTSDQDAAYDLFDEWSSTGSKYGGSDDTLKKWNSLQPTPAGRMPVTIRTLLKQAVEGGWDNQKVREQAYSNTSDWLDKAGTVLELRDLGLKKIISTPQISSTEEEMLLSKMKEAAFGRFGYRVSITCLRKDLARLKADVKDKEQAKEERREPPWAKGLCYVTTTQQFYRPSSGEKFKVIDFNARFSRFILPTTAELREAGIPVTRETLSRPLLEPNIFVLNHLKCPVAYDYAYDPSRPMEMFFSYNQKRFVNTYAPTYPEMDATHAAECGAMLQHHLSNLIAEPEYRTILTDFLAYMVQFPGRKIRWAVMIQSVDGAGKTYLSEVMKAVLGSEHVELVSGESIKTGWNEWSFGHQLVVIEEVRIAGTNRHEIMNALKPLITNDFISVNQKFRDSRQTQNISNYMLFTNHHDGLVLRPGDRRYLVLESPLQTREQVLALGENYFPPLYQMLKEHPGGMRAWLHDYKISPTFSPSGHAPRTKYAELLIEDSASDLTAAVRRLITEADYPLVQYDIVSSTKLTELLQLEVGNVSPQHLAKVLREEGYHSAGRHMLNGGDRQMLWSRNGMSEADAVKSAEHRVKHNLKNLSMEVLF